MRSSQVLSPAIDRQGRHERPVPALLGLAGAMAWLVGAEGSGTWQVARVALVGLVAVAVVRAARRPVAIVLAGVLGVAVGVGIAVPHLTKDGVSLTAAAGAVALVAGLVLLVEVVVASRHRWRTGLAALVAAALGLFVVGQAVAATNVPPTGIGSRTPATFGVDYDDVVLPTSDGVVLSGWFVPSRSGAAVVLLHGAGSTRSAVLPHAMALAREGYGALLVDARGHGRSDGRAMDFGWYGDQDIDAAVRFLLQRPDVDRRRIALLGLSMGGEQAIGAGMVDSRVAAVVAEGATGRTAADKAWLSEAFGLRGALHEVLERAMFGVTDLLTSASPPRSLRAAVTADPAKPLLLITADAVPDERRVALRLQAGAPSAEIWTATGTDHTDALARHPQEWTRRVTSFLDRAW